MEPYHRSYEAINKTFDLLRELIVWELEKTGRIAFFCMCVFFFWKDISIHFFSIRCTADDLGTFLRGNSVASKIIGR